MDEIIGSFLNLPFWILIPALITGGLYALLIFRFYSGWRRIPAFVSDKQELSGVKASIIVAFRNEEKNLSQLVADLSAQSYSEKLFEVIFIDDHSEDGSAEIVRNLIKDLPSFILKKNQGKGKKHAIETGMEISTGDFIVTTDADCRMNKHWLVTLALYFERESPQMILGPVLPINRKGFLFKMAALEFCSLIASAAGSSGAGHPVLSNGANLAYPKSILKNCKDPYMKSFASGDDIFLMQNLKKLRDAKIHFIKSRNAIVQTRMPETFKEFWQQRVRWASKTKAFTDSDMKITGLLVLGMNFFIAFSFFAILFRFEWFFLFFLLLLMKSLPDFLLMNSFLKYFERKDLLKYFILLQPVYPFYVIFAAFFGLFSRNYRWKGRSW